MNHQARKTFRRYKPFKVIGNIPCDAPALVSYPSHFTPGMVKRELICAMGYPDNIAVKVA